MKRLAALAALLVLAGCGNSKDEGISGGGKVIGSTVTVYSLAPDPGGTSRDFVDGQKLALSDAGGRAGQYSVNFTSLDLGAADDTAAQAESVRRAINDPAIIAAIVSANRVTVPLFNAAGILQVAPGDTSPAKDPNLLPSGRETVFGVSGQAPSDLQARFREAFDRAPGREAQDGYRAMAGVLAAIKNAGAAGNDRTRVIDSY
jgi:hypothetical protein